MLLLLGFLSFILLIINDKILLVTLLSCGLKILSNSLIRQFLLLQYELYYKNKLASLFRSISKSTRFKCLFSVTNSFKKHLKKTKGYMCCSLLLQGRVDILESVKNSIFSPDKLVSKAEKNLEQTGVNYASNSEYEDALKHEVRALSEKKKFELDLAYQDVKNQADQERLAARSQGSSQDGINNYANEAGDLYTKGLRKLWRAIEDTDL